MTRTCAYPLCTKPAKPNGRFCSKAHRQADWKRRTGYVKPPARDARETPQKRRGGGPRGADLPWRRSVLALASGLADLQRLPSDEQEAVELAEALLAPALSEKQAARVGLTSVGVAGREATPGDDALAKRIARTHNALRAAMTDGGVIAFSEQGRAVWPLADDDQFALPIERLPFPVQDGDVSVAEVKSWLEHHRKWQAEAFELREAERAERHARGEIRRGEDQRHYGMVRGAANCESCGHFKSSHAAICTHCGDVPGTHHGDPRDVDIAHGRAA